MNNTELNERLRALRQTLPHGSLFQYRLADDSLYIEKLTIPGHLRGVGTAFMTQVIEAADAAELPVELHAHATGRATDPSQKTIEAWYRKLGFEAGDPEDEGLFMRRLVQREETPSWVNLTHAAPGAGMSYLLNPRQVKDTPIEEPSLENQQRSARRARAR